MPHYPQVPLDNRPIRPQTHQLPPGYAAPIKQGFTMAGIWCRRESGRNVTTAHDLPPISAALAAYDLSLRQLGYVGSDPPTPRRVTAAVRPSACGESAQ